MKSIKWIATGGTFSSEKSAKGLAPASSKKQMMKILSELESIPAKISLLPLMNIDSTEISCEDIVKIGISCDAAIKAGCDGIVITHGTDTMAYTAAILERMMCGCPVPVIITGSQRPFFDKASDGKANLSNAFSAACQDIRGVHILFGNRLIEGGKAHKAYTKSDNAFISPDGKYSGVISDGRIICGNKASHEKYNFREQPLHSAGLIKITPMTRPEEIENAARLYDGLVIEGYGLGGIPSRLLPAVKAATESGVRCVLISQCLFEGVTPNVYEVGIAALECGVISGGELTAEGALAKMIFGEI